MDNSKGIEFPDIIALRHMQTDWGCDSMYMACINVRQTISQHWEGEVDPQTSTKPKSSLALRHLGERKRFHPWGNIGYIKHTLGQASCWDIVGQHKRNPIIFVCKQAFASVGHLPRWRICFATDSHFSTWLEPNLGMKDSKLGSSRLLIELVTREIYLLGMWQPSDRQDREVARALVWLHRADV